MLNECLGIINLTTKQKVNMSHLTNARPIASIPIAGRYRIVDFVLSNMVNSGIRNIGVYTKAKYRSLTDHLSNGKDWDLSRKKGGLYIFSPENTNVESRYSHKPGDIHGIFANIDYIDKSSEEYILIAPSYMICNIDYNEAFEYHKQSKNDITMIYKTVNNADKEFKLSATLVLDEDRVVNMGSNVGILSTNNVSMETYIMKREKFMEYIYECVTNGDYTYIEDFIADSLKRLQVGSYEHKGYLRCINSLESYFEMSKEFLEEDISNELLFSDRKVLTKDQGQTPTIYTQSADVENSFIATGCVIEGSVKNSIIFRKVHVKPGCVIENSIIMKGCEINRDVKLDNVIFDKFVSIAEGKELKGDKNYPIVIQKNTSI